MKILTICYEYPPIGGGGSVVASALAQQLVRRGSHVEVVTSNMPGLEPTEMMNGVRVHRSNCLRKHRHYTSTAELLTTLIPTYRKAAAEIRRCRPDVLHAHFVIPSGFVAWLLSKWFGIPYVLTAHGSDIPGYNPDRFALAHTLLLPLWRKIMRDAAGVTSPSEFLAGLIRSETDVPVHIVPNGYSPESSGDSSKRNMVLVVSRLFPRKGVQHFLEAIRDLDSDWEFVIAGDGPFKEELEAMARQVRPTVTFVGFVGKSRLRQLYQQARIMVFPSIRENFPMVLLEGMDAGCAVISTSAEGCAEVIGNTGMAVKPGCPVQIRSALEDLMSDPVRCEVLGEQARIRAQLFSWPRIADMYMDVFLEVERERSAAPEHVG